MSFRLIGLLGLLALSTGSLADSEAVVISAVEMTSSNVRIPPASNGRLQFRPCAGGCKIPLQVARLSDATRYSVNGEALNFKEFREAFFNRPYGSEDYVLVVYDTASMRVQKVQLDVVSD